VPGAGFPLSSTHHYVLPAAVKAVVGGRAADYQACVSVDTIIRASSCRATERPSCKLRSCLRAPTATGRALGRSRALHRANIAFATTFPAPWRPHTGVEHHGGEVHANPPAGVGALPTNLFPYVFQEGGGAASQGPTGDRILGGLSSGPLQAPASRPTPSAGCPWAASVSGDVHLAVMRNSGLGEDLQKKGCVPRCLSPNPDFLHDTAWSQKMSTCPPHRGHGLPAQSAGSKGTHRCHLSSLQYWVPVRQSPWSATWGGGRNPSTHITRLLCFQQGDIPPGGRLDKCRRVNLDQPG